MENSILILSDYWGVYIPQQFCSHLDAADAARINVDFIDVEACQNGPEHPTYWDSWQAILDSAAWQDDSGRDWQLFQSGDLWEIAADFELPDYLD